MLNANNFQFFRFGSKSICPLLTLVSFWILMNNGKLEWESYKLTNNKFLFNWPIHHSHIYKVLFVWSIIGLPIFHLCFGTIHFPFQAPSSLQIACLNFFSLQVLVYLQNKVVHSIKIEMVMLLSKRELIEVHLFWRFMN